MPRNLYTQSTYLYEAASYAKMIRLDPEIPRVFFTSTSNHMI